MAAATSSPNWTPVDEASRGAIPAGDDPYAGVPPVGAIAAEPPPEGAEGPRPAEKVYAHLVEQELLRLRARQEAQRLLRAETRPPVPSFVSLREFLAVEDEPTQYRIEGVMPVGARILLAAQFKAGKTTAMGNLLRSLADGDPFLGHYEVAQPAGAIALIDDEMDEAKLRQWLREQGIRNVDAVQLVPLRGRVSSFDIRDPEVLEEWADNLGALGASVVVLDCLRPVLDALGLDENSEVGQLLVPFDELMLRAGAREAVVVHHMGHVGERARGASRLLDWPDALWKLVRQDEDPSSTRFFSAYGRDVDVPESQLGYDPLTRRLTIVGGSRKVATAQGIVPAVLELLPAEQDKAMSGRQVEEALVAAGEKQKDARAALKLAVSDGRVLTAPGPHRSTLHWLADPSASVRRSASPVRQRAESECVSASIGDALTRTDEPEPGASADELCSRCRRDEVAVTALGLCRACAYPTETDDEGDQDA